MRRSHDRISEAVFQQQVIDLAKFGGFRVYHTFLSKRSEAGFPDLVIVRGDMKRPLFVELKRESGKLTEEQKRWGMILDVIPGADYRIWRPSDWPEIEQTLAKRRST